MRAWGDEDSYEEEEFKPIVKGVIQKAADTEAIIVSSIDSTAFSL